MVCDVYTPNLDIIVHSAGRTRGSFKFRSCRISNLSVITCTWDNGLRCKHSRPWHYYCTLSCLHGGREGREGTGIGAEHTLLEQLQVMSLKQLNTQVTHQTQLHAAALCYNSDCLKTFCNRTNLYSLLIVDHIQMYKQRLFQWFSKVCTLFQNSDDTTRYNSGS